SSTQADGAQSSRVPIPLSEDPYEAIRQAYLVGTDTESEPFEDLGTELPESPHTVASPISFPDSIPPTCRVEESEGSDTSGRGSTSSDSTTPLSPDHPLTHDTPVLVPPFRRTARMVSSPSPSPTLPVWKRYRSTSELLLVTDNEEDADEDEGDESLDEGELTSKVNAQATKAYVQ
ncbi:hypothetical protein Tco_1191004, partial [Tanacetum coccineum]